MLDILDSTKNITRDIKNMKNMHFWILVKWDSFSYCCLNKKFWTLINIALLKIFFYILDKIHKTCFLNLTFREPHFHYRSGKYWTWDPTCIFIPFMHEFSLSIHSSSCSILSSWYQLILCLSIVYSQYGSQRQPLICKANHCPPLVNILTPSLHPKLSFSLSDLIYWHSPWLTMCQLCWPPFSFNKPGTFQPQDLCTGYYFFQ